MKGIIEYGCQIPFEELLEKLSKNGLDETSARIVQDGSVAYKGIFRTGETPFSVIVSDRSDAEKALSQAFESIRMSELRDEAIEEAKKEIIGGYSTFRNWNIVRFSDGTEDVVALSKGEAKAYAEKSISFIESVPAYCEGDLAEIARLSGRSVESFFRI